MKVVRPWMALFDGDIVTAQNMVLCEAKTAVYKPTSDGDDATKALWDSQHTAAMGLEELVDLFRRAHRRR